MKSVFVLGVLLHVCYSAEFNSNLNKEIIHRLMKLHSHIPYNITSPLLVPLVQKRTRRTCIDTFAKKLSLLLNNVTVPEKSQHLLHELKVNLQALSPVQDQAAGDSQKSDQTCHFKQIMTTNTSMTFKRYAIFLQMLNAMRER